MFLINLVQGATEKEKLWHNPVGLWIKQHATSEGYDVKEPKLLVFRGRAQDSASRKCLYPKPSYNRRFSALAVLKLQDSAWHQQVNSEKRKEIAKLEVFARYKKKIKA